MLIFTLMLTNMHIQSLVMHSYKANECSPVNKYPLTGMEKNAATDTFTVK